MFTFEFLNAVACASLTFNMGSFLSLRCGKRYSPFAASSRRLMIVSAAAVSGIFRVSRLLEINENQRRVPSSLRWDLVRLVRTKGDEAAITAQNSCWNWATLQPGTIALQATEIRLSRLRPRI